MNYYLLVRVCLCLFCLTSWRMVIAQSPAAVAERKYKPGEKHRYELTTEYYQNRQWKSRTVAVCEVEAQSDPAGVPFELVKWISQITITDKDTIDESAMAARVQPYQLSLHPKGSLQLPKITEPGMTGAVTDFHTFYVAIHEKAGISRLKKQGDSYQAAAPVKGNFGNGLTILKGEDCINVSSSLLALTPAEAILQTNFLPPVTPCLEYYQPSFSQPVSGDTLNNIQMIMAAANDKLNLQFGKEHFTIVSHINRQDGLLTEASMTNELILKLKVNCNKDLQGCQAELPWHIYRELRLKLLL